MNRTGAFPAPNSGLAYLLFRTTPRDRYLAAMLYEHRALTSAQIAELAFSTPRRANQRLAELTTLKITDRTRQNPAFHGSRPYIYTLGPAGALLLAAERDMSVKDLRYDRAVLIRQAARPDLAHTLGCNTLLIHLAIRHRTTQSGPRLAVWWGPISALRLWGDAIRPDAYLVITNPNIPAARERSAGYFFEYDTGTESVTQLADKIHGYHRFSQNYSGHHPTLIHLPSTAREQRLHQKITDAYPRGCPVPIATSTRSDLATGWLPAPGPRQAPSSRLAIGEVPAAFTASGYRLLPARTTDPQIHAPAPSWGRPGPTATDPTNPADWEEDPPCSPGSPLSQQPASFFLSS